MKWNEKVIIKNSNWEDARLRRHTSKILCVEDSDEVPTTRRHMQNNEFFEENFCETWPPTSCDPTPMGYSLSGYAKLLVYADKLDKIDALEESVRKKWSKS